jgi:hypothetical protein
LIPTDKQEEFQVHNVINHLCVFIQVLAQKKLVEKEQNDISKKTVSVANQVNITVKGFSNKLLVDQLSSSDIQVDISKLIPDNHPVYSRIVAAENHTKYYGLSDNQKHIKSNHISYSFITKIIL